MENRSAIEIDKFESSSNEHDSDEYKFASEAGEFCQEFYFDKEFEIYETWHLKHDINEEREKYYCEIIDMIIREKFICKIYDLERSYFLLIDKSVFLALAFFVLSVTPMLIVFSMERLKIIAGSGFSFVKFFFSLLCGVFISYMYAQNIKPMIDNHIMYDKLRKLLCLFRHRQYTIIDNAESGSLFYSDESTAIYDNTYVRYTDNKNELQELRENLMELKQASEKLEEELEEKINFFSNKAFTCLAVCYNVILSIFFTVIIWPHELTRDIELMLGSIISIAVGSCLMAHITFSPLLALYHSDSYAVAKQNNDNIFSSALFIASAEGDADAAGLLLEAGADKDKANNSRETPLLAASYFGHLTTVQALLDAGADKDKEDNDGVTPLCAAAENGHLEIVQALLEAGADKNKARNDGLTPLDIAKRERHDTVIQTLQKMDSPLFVSLRQEPISESEFFVDRSLKLT